MPESPCQSREHPVLPKALLQRGLARAMVGPVALAPGAVPVLLGLEVGVASVGLAGQARVTVVGMAAPGGGTVAVAATRPAEAVGAVVAGARFEARRDEYYAGWCAAIDGKQVRW